MTAEEIEKKALEYRNHTKEHGESNVEAYARQIAYEAGAHMRDAEVEELKKKQVHFVLQVEERVLSLE